MCRYFGSFEDFQASDLGSVYEPLRADKFLNKHIDSIESMLKRQRGERKRRLEKAAIEMETAIVKKLQISRKLEVPKP